MLGKAILHYEFREKIGSGGMGEVFKAHDRRLNRDVAIKALPYGMSADPERRRRFAQEALAASALNHPNIITIHDVLHEGDTHFIVMEYVVGRTLLASIPPGGMRIREMLLCSAQMASALRVAHEAGIVHRDFKPANVMIGNSGLVKILDFGLAKLLLPHSSTEDPAGISSEAATVQIGNSSTISGSPQTAEGSILGTLNYMSPEQAEGKRVDGRTDIFALGAVMYEMLTGCKAFQGESDIGTLSAVLRDEVKPIYGIVPSVPPELDNLIRTCLHKDPGARWQSMKEVEEALIVLKRRADAGEFSGRLTAQPSVPQRAIERLPVFAGVRANRKKLLIATGVVTVVLLAALSAFFVFRSRFASLQPKPAGVSAVVASPAGTTPANTSPSNTSPAQPAPPVPAPEPVPVASSTAPTPARTPPSPAAPAAAAPAAPKNGSPQVVAPSAAAASKANTPPVRAPLTPIPVPEPPKPSPAVTGSSTPVQPVTVTIGDGMAFSIALAQDVRNDAAEGSELTFRSAEDVRIGDVLVIARGATVKGSIVNGAGKASQGTSVTFQLTTAESVGGQKIPVRASVTRRADGPTTRPIDTGRYAKPKDLAAARGTDYIAYIDGDHTLTLQPAPAR